MIYLDSAKKEPLYEQLYKQLREEIINGTLKESQVLTGSRALAKTLHVSRNTVDHAYNQLLSEGYLIPSPGIGYLVAALPSLKLPKKKSVVSTPSLKEKADTCSVPLYDLTNSSHTSDLFPKNLWRKYTLECLDRLERESRISIYQDKQGEEYLRSNLLSYLKRIRGVDCKENQIIITCGLQQSLDYLCKLLSLSESCVWMEEPGYHKAAAVFATNHVPIHTIPVDADGMVTEHLPQVSGTGALYCTPSHQFPTGVTMPIGRRYELLQWAVNNNIYILEDDFDSEQRYYAKPIPSLQSIDSHERVIYLGTFSKALSPSIRMGYMILPPRLCTLYQEQFINYNSTAPLLNQYVIGRLMETGQYDRHVRRLNHIFRNRLELFEKELKGMQKYVTISGNGTGQYFLLKFHQKIDQKLLIDSALSEGVKVYSTMQFWQEKAACPLGTLFLGFSKIDLKDIPDCVNRLKKAWKPWLM